MTIAEARRLLFSRVQPCFTGAVPAFEGNSERATVVHEGLWPEAYGSAIYFFIGTLFALYKNIILAKLTGSSPPFLGFLKKN